MLFKFLKLLSLSNKSIRIQRLSCLLYFDRLPYLSLITVCLKLLPFLPYIMMDTSDNALGNAHINGTKDCFLKHGAARTKGGAIAGKLVPICR